MPSERIKAIYEGANEVFEKNYNSNNQAGCFTKENFDKAIKAMEELSGKPFKPYVDTPNDEFLCPFPVHERDVENIIKVCMNGIESTKAILEDGWYLCGCCGHKLARRVNNGVQVFEPVSCHNSPDNWNPAIEIKCKHKSNGKKCDSINIIEI